MVVLHYGEDVVSKSKNAVMNDSASTAQWLKSTVLIACMVNISAGLSTVCNMY